MMGGLFRKLARSDCTSSSSSSSGSISSSNRRKKTKDTLAQEGGSVSVPQCASSPPPSDDQEDETHQQQQPQFEHEAENLQGRQQRLQDEDRERRETEHWQRLIEGQKKREQNASARNQYVKQQRVRYYHKTSDQWIDEAVVVGVHYDDGPDKPYYTIKYNLPEDGSTMEKQTTEDRLEEVEFDEQKTWEILDVTKKR